LKKQLLTAVLLMMPSAFAGVLISNPTTGVVSSGLGTSGVTATVTNVALGTGVTGSGTACFAPFCPGGSTPGAGPDYDVLDPVTFRFTDVSIVCTAPSCGNFTMRAAFSFVATSSGLFDIGVGVDGFSTGGASGSITGVIGNGSSFLVGNQTFSYLQSVIVRPGGTGGGTGNGTATNTLPGTTTTTKQPGIQDSFQLGTLAIEQGQTVRGQLIIRVDSMNASTLSFPNSVTMSLVDVPEPASLAFLAMGLAALAVARVSRKA